MKGIFYIVLGIVLCAGTSMVLRPREEPVLESTDKMELGSVLSVTGTGMDGSIALGGLGNSDLVYALGPDGKWMEVPEDGHIELGRMDERITAGIVSMPTSISWLHPEVRQPSALVLRVAEKLGEGRIGPTKMMTLVTEDHGHLPVVSILIAEGALFDPDTGIYVVGNAILHPTAEMVDTHVEDGRWWKYPGNFHFRGKEWQRSGLIHLLDGNGTEVFGSTVGVRINGQMTRGYPMHALRLLFDEPINTALFADGDGAGSTILLLRSAGNDQMKAMMRDVLAHELCRGEPFEISRSLSCVVYINGAYWGVHQLRQRVEEEEIARRYGVSDKDIAMLEVRSNRVLGKKKQVSMFDNDLSKALTMDVSSIDFGADLSERFDVEGFFSYMASVMILDNNDWPDANIKFWRYTGKESMDPPLDGRWHFILTDMDLGLGAYGEPDAPLLERLKDRTSPMPRLFNACMRSPDLRKKFITKVEELINGRFATNTTIDALDRIAARMEPEMPRHIARWRRPANMVTWQMEVDRIRNYLRARPEQIRSQIPGMFQ